MRQNYIYICTISVLFLAITVVFDFFPRSKYSPLEKRDLALFPTFTTEALASGEYTKQINSWFSDTEPYRDMFLSLSMQEKNAISLSLSDDDVTFHASDDTEEQPTDEEIEANERNVAKYKNTVTADENATIANRGIIVIGKGDKTRALMAYGGGAKGGVDYANSANEYKKAFPNVNVYCMVIPTAVDFYCPEKAKKASNEELPTINNVYAHLDKGVHAVDVYTVLGQHAAEDIYLRTDHHWSPLGGYYAAQKFCQIAKLPFKSLDSYERKVVHGYVGSMYAYSKDIALKNNPEDFVYYVPKNIQYTTTYTNYTINRDYQITGESAPCKGPYFVHYSDGSGGAYCTFMGGDSKITKIQTGNKNHRRLIILKDSFGNTIPGYLFYSFEEIHIIDDRYFSKNMRDYVKQNKITDILFANNVFSAYSSKTSSKYIKFLNQPNGTYEGRQATTKKDLPVKTTLAPIRKDSL